MLAAGRTAPRGRPAPGCGRPPWSAARSGAPSSRTSATASTPAGPTRPEDEVVTELAGSATSESARTAYREETGDLPLVAQLRPARRPQPRRPRAGRPRRADPGRPVRGQGVAAAPPGPGRAPAGRLPGPAPGGPHPDRVGHHDRDRHHRDHRRDPEVLRDYPVTAAGSCATTRWPSRPARYWCGPTSMQMIAWGWSHDQRSQQALGRARSAPPRRAPRSRRWSGSTNAKHRLGPRGRTPGSTSCSTSRAGPTASGTSCRCGTPSTTGRRSSCTRCCSRSGTPTSTTTRAGTSRSAAATTRTATEPNLLRYFEPWNQQRFDRSEPYIERRQLRSAYRAYRANQEHFQHNIGV